MLGESEAPSGTCIYIPERGQAMGKVWQERDEPVCNIIQIRFLSNEVSQRWRDAGSQAAVVSEFLVCACQRVLARAFCLLFPLCVCLQGNILNLFWYLRKV